MANKSEHVIRKVEDHKIKCIETPPAASSRPRRVLPAPSSASHPKRLARDAMKRLKEGGVDVSDATSGNKVLFYLASVSPELLEHNVRAACASPPTESHVWRSLLGDEVIPVKGTPQREITWKKYLHLDQLIPTAVLVESGMHITHHAHQAKSLVLLVHRAYPGREDDAAFLRAASIVLCLKGENSLFKRLRSKKEDGYDDYLPDIEFIASRVNEVEKIIPVLRERETTAPATVAVLLESATASLSNGML